MNAYTEGLVYRNGRLYESTGRVGQSSIREVDLASGRELRRTVVPKPYFGEGISPVGKRWYQLTWKSGTGFIYDQQLRRTGTWHYSGEGWGMTYDGHHLIMSDGSAMLRLLDPKTLQVAGTLAVRDRGEPVDSLNELEAVGDSLFANIWLTDSIVRIDAATGRLTGWMDLSALKSRFDKPPGWVPGDDVLNGIAYDPASGHLLVTGKCWPKLFEIEVEGLGPGNGQ